MAAASVLIIVKHRANIRRLLAGTENRFGARHA
jgi:glycerol-3-phosphate acyltransferase PlsY